VGHTDGGGLDHVADGESLDCLVLGSASRAVGAADGLDVATALLVTTAGILLALQVQQLRSWVVRGRVAYLDARFLTMLG
jgi:hypothetical protein